MVKCTEKFQIVIIVVKQSNSININFNNFLEYRKLHNVGNYRDWIKNNKWSWKVYKISQELNKVQD